MTTLQKLKALMGQLAGQYWTYKRFSTEIKPRQIRQAREVFSIPQSETVLVNRLSGKEGYVLTDRAVYSHFLHQPMKLEDIFSVNPVEFPSTQEGSENLAGTHGFLLNTTYATYMRRVGLFDCYAILGAANIVREEKQYDHARAEFTIVSESIEKIDSACELVRKKAPLAEVTQELTCNGVAPAGANALAQTMQKVADRTKMYSTIFGIIMMIIGAGILAAGGWVITGGATPSSSSVEDSFNAMTIALFVIGLIAGGIGFYFWYCGSHPRNAKETKEICTRAYYDMYENVAEYCGVE